MTRLVCHTKGLVTQEHFLWGATGAGEFIGEEPDGENTTEGVAVGIVGATSSTKKEVRLGDASFVEE